MNEDRKFCTRSSFFFFFTHFEREAFYFYPGERGGEGGVEGRGRKGEGVKELLHIFFFLLGVKSVPALWPPSPASRPLATTPAKRLKFSNGSSIPISNSQGYLHVHL